MIYDIYKFLIENEENILKDLSLLKYIKVDMDTVVLRYVDELVRTNFHLDPEQHMDVMTDSKIQYFILGMVDTLRRTIYGDKDSLH
jgi:hypothetical protein